MLPILLATVVPFVICIALALVLRPKDGVQYDYPTTVIVTPPARGHIYFSDSYGKKPAPFKYQTYEDPADPSPIGDNIDALMRASEARLQAAFRATDIAQKILIELGQKAQAQYQLAA